MKVRLGDEFWKERIEVRKQEIEELKAQVQRLEAQLTLCFEIMNDRQIAENQHLFQRDIQIPDSDTIKKAE